MEQEFIKAEASGNKKIEEHYQLKLKELFFQRK